MSVGGGQGSTSVQIGRYNQRQVLRTLRRLGEASKADLARATGLSNAAIGSIIRDLEAAGLVRIIGKRHDGARGQPATLLKLDAEGAFGIGVRLDRARIEVVLADLSGRILARRASTSLPSPDRALGWITEQVATLLGTLNPGERMRVLGVGLARPFSLGAWARELDTGEGTNPWGNDWPEAIERFAADLESATGLPVTEENDGTAAAIAESFYGLGAPDLLYLFLAPAIGGGVVLNGDPLQGASGNAGDVAMLPVGPSLLSSGLKPGGRAGGELLIARASMNALLRHLRSRGEVVPGSLAAAVERDPEGFAEWAEDCADALVGPVQAARALLDIPLVVLDGDLDRPLLEDVRLRLDALCRERAPEARTPPEFALGSFGPAAGALGAASLPLHHSLAPRTRILTVPLTRGEATLGGAHVG